MRFVIITLLFLAATCGVSLAKTESAAPLLPGDTRIKLLKYDETDVYTITTKYGYQTNIVFGANEEIQTISVGDRSLWQLIPSGNRLFIRPMEEGVQTNMTLITNKHSYQFDLKSLSGEKGKGNIYVAQFVYAPDKPKTSGASTLPQAAAAAAMPLIPVTQNAIPATPVPEKPAPVPLVRPPQNIAAIAPPATTAAANYDYTYTGPDDSAPALAYDDGTSTYIQYSDGQTLPAISTIDDSGKLTSVSYEVKNNMIIIPAIAPQWQLDGKTGSVMLYNETLNPQQ